VSFLSTNLADFEVLPVSCPQVDIEAKHSLVLARFRLKSPQRAALPYFGVHFIGYRSIGFLTRQNSGYPIVYGGLFDVNSTVPVWVMGGDVPGFYGTRIDERFELSPGDYDFRVANNHTSSVVAVTVLGVMHVLAVVSFESEQFFSSKFSETSLVSPSFFTPPVPPPSVLELPEPPTEPPQNLVLSYTDYSESRAPQLTIGSAPQDGYRPGVIIQWQRPFLINGLTYLKGVEEKFGPHRDIEDARTFLKQVLAFGTDKTDDAKGFFSGIIGRVSYEYSFELDAETKTWHVEYEFKTPGGQVGGLS